MKKNFLPLVILIIVISLAACKSSSSFEGDVRKMADYRCKQQQLEAGDLTNEKTKKELADLTKEMADYREKMAKKYESTKGDTAMNHKADKIMDEVMSKCK